MGTESRKLAAIVFADMVGFSALRQTVALELREAMMALATQELALHRGRLVNTMGDGFFAEFPTALDAVQFAVALQEAVEARNSASPEAARLRLRIGAHVGEVIIQGDNLLGENINIASRTEELAAPGGICMTNQVWEQVRDDLGARPRSLGKIRARHIQLPLTFYHIDPPGSGLRFRLAHRFRTGALGLGRIPVTVAILLMLCLLALLLWGQRRPRTAEAFFNRAGKALENYDQDGNLARAVSDLNEAVSMDRSNPRILSRLGWACWLMKEDEDRDEYRSDASRWSSNALNTNPENHEGHLVQGLVARDMRQWEAATNHLLKAKDLTRSADGLVLISLAFACLGAGDGGNARAFAELAEASARKRWLVFDRLGQFQTLTDPLVRGKERARGHFEEAVRLAPNSPLAHRHLGQLRLLQGARDVAFKEFEQSLKLRRTPQGLSAVGSAYYSAGLSDQALKYFEEALRMDPTRYTYHLGAALALRQVRDRKVESDAHFAQALRQTEDILSANKGKSLARAVHGLCQAALGNPEEARRDLEQAVSEAPLDAQVLQMAYRGYQILPDPTRASEILRLINPDAR